jgi:hypothetical protein
MPRKTKESKRSWIVTVKAKVKKSIVVTDCTEEEARTDPFKHAISEDEIEQIDWEVLDVEVNE